MILQDRWMGSEVVNRVRNQLEAYKLVWIAWDWKEKFEITRIVFVLLFNTSECVFCSISLGQIVVACISCYLKMGGKIRYVFLDEYVQLVHAQSQLCHGGFEHFSHSIVLHDPDQNGKSVLFRHLHQQKTNDESSSLAIANLQKKQCTFSKDKIYDWNTLSFYFLSKISLYYMNISLRYSSLTLYFDSIPYRATYQQRCLSLPKDT